MAGSASTPVGRSGVVATRGGGSGQAGPTAAPLAGQMVGGFRFPLPPPASAASPVDPPGSSQAPPPPPEPINEPEEDAVVHQQPSPSQLAQGHRGIKLWVRPETAPFADHTRDAAEIQRLVSLEIMKVPVEEPSPGFNGTQIIRGSVTFNCVNNYTAEWLSRYLSGIVCTANDGTELRLKITDHEYRADLVRVNAWFPKEHPDPQQCVDYIGYMNREKISVESKRWRLLNRVWVDNGTRYRVLLLIPTKDWEQITEKLGPKPVLRCGLFMIPMWVPVRKIPGPRVPALGDTTEFPDPVATRAPATKE